MTDAAALVLWDIDRTLLTIEGVSLELYATAFRQVTGRELARMPDMAGKTDLALMQSVLGDHGLEITEPLLDAFGSTLVATARARHERMRAKGRALPGAREALDALARVPGLVQSVVTGNLRPIAELKLGLFGLAEHIDFEVGGYGSDDHDRAVLVRRALERAEAKYSAGFPAGRAAVVGDTVHDVAGALANGLAAIGVASGSSPVEELAASGAQAVLPSLIETDEVTRTVVYLLSLTDPE